MLPPKELNTTCLRCKADMPLGERYCSKCGADRELELAVAGELDPAIASLRRWLLALGCISLLLAWLVYSDLRRFSGMSSEQALRALWPSFGLAFGLLALYLPARRFPLVSSLLALVLFAGHWTYAAVLFGVSTAFSPNIALAARTIFLLVLVGAVKAGWRARVLRARAAESFPTAVARERRGPATTR
jgi:hypothetical protein